LDAFFQQTSITAVFDSSRTATNAVAGLHTDFFQEKEIPSCTTNDTGPSMLGCLDVGMKTTRTIMHYAPSGEGWS